MELRLPNALDRYDFQNEAEFRRDIEAFARTTPLGSGTKGALPKWTDQGTLGDSFVTEDAVAHIVTVGSPTVDGISLAIQGLQSGVRDLLYYSGSGLRWVLRADSTAEGGANAGTNFVINRRSDAGANLGNAVTIARATGEVTLESHLYPAADASKDLGAIAARWRNVFAQALSDGDPNTSQLIGSSGTNLRIAAGSGWAAIEIYVGATLRWKFDANGHFLPGTDVATDIGSATKSARGVYSANYYDADGSQVVSTRVTGWQLPTGTLTKTTFDTATVTLPQLAQRVYAIISALKDSHGLIGA